MKNRLITIAIAVAACLGCLISALFLDSSDLCRSNAGNRKLSNDEKMQIIKSVAVLESESIDWGLLRERYHEYASSTAMSTIGRGTGETRRLQSYDDFLSQKRRFFSPFLSLSWVAGGAARSLLGSRALEHLEVSPSVSQSLSLTFGPRNESGIIDNVNVTIEVNVAATLNATVVASPVNDLNSTETLPEDNFRVATTRKQQNATISLGSQNVSTILGGENTTVNINGLNVTISKDGQNLTASIDDHNAVVTVGNVSATLKDTVQVNDDAVGLDDDVLPSASVTTSLEPSIAPGGMTVSVSSSTAPTDVGVPSAASVSVSESMSPSSSIEPSDGGIPTSEPTDMLISVSQSPSMDFNTSMSPSPIGAGVPSSTPVTVSMSMSPSPSVEPTGAGAPSTTLTPTTYPTTVDEPTTSPSSPINPSRTPQSRTKKPTTRSRRPTIISPQSLTKKPTKKPTKTPTKIPTKKPTKKPIMRTSKPIGKPTRVPVPTTRSPNVGGVVIPAYKYDRGNCPKKGSTGLPCAPNNLAQLCSKYDSNNRGRFRACLKACEPSFCCIHDAPEETNSIAPTCIEDENCPQYAPCYIVWWKIHDTIGPAAYLRLSQNDDFFDVDKLQDVTTDRNFYAQWAYHHWDNIDDLLDNILDDADGLQNLFANPSIWDGKP